jgi:hypothetical protein
MPFSSLGELLYTLEHSIRRSPYHVAFTIVDKGRPDPSHPGWDSSLAGFVAPVGASPETLSVELGALRIFPAF